MKHYKIKKFFNEAKKIKIADEILNKTLENFLETSEEGKQRFSLGAGLYKLRLATAEGKGKSGGSRSILAFKQESQIIWLHVFAKHDKENVTIKELKRLKVLSDILLNLSDSEIKQLIKLGELYEVKADV